jgi:hypothetical protein
MHVPKFMSRIQLSTTISQVTSVPEHFDAITYIKILFQSFALNPIVVNLQLGQNKNYVFIFFGLKSKTEIQLSSLPI